MARSVASGFAPVSPETAFDIWADFQKFPEFMPGCVEVVMAGMVANVTLEHNGTKENCRLGWSVIEKPRRLLWRTRGGAKWNGEVTFYPHSEGCMINLTIDFEPSETQDPTKQRMITPTWPVAETLVSFKRYVEEA